MMQRLAIAVCFITLVTEVAAQQSAGTSRLQQMEGIYQKELSARHVPLLSKHLVELQRQATSATDQPAYQAEITRLQQIISAGGVLDLMAAQQSQSGAMPAPAPIGRKQALIALSPTLAQTISPTPDANAAIATIGEADWRIERIDAGSYDVLLQYACPELREPLSIRVEFSGQTLEKKLATDRVTKDAQTFRILRLGSLTLTGDQRCETLRLTVGDKTSVKLILKNLLITRSRPPAANP